MKNKPHIWVLDDQPMLQELVEFRLGNELDCNISKFDSAEAALTKLDEVTSGHHHSGLFLEHRQQ